MRDAASRNDIILTITRSTEPLIMKEWLKPGTHLSCIGADMVGNEENWNSCRNLMKKEVEK